MWLLETTKQMNTPQGPAQMAFHRLFESLDSLTNYALANDMKSFKVVFMQVEKERKVEVPS